MPAGRIDVKIHRNLIRPLKPNHPQQILMVSHRARITVKDWRTRWSASSTDDYGENSPFTQSAICGQRKVENTAIGIVTDMKRK